MTGKAIAQDIQETHTGGGVAASHEFKRLLTSVILAESPVRSKASSATSMSKDAGQVVSGVGSLTDLRYCDPERNAVFQSLNIASASLFEMAVTPLRTTRARPKGVPDRMMSDRLQTDGIAIRSSGKNGSRGSVSSLLTSSRQSVR